MELPVAVLIRLLAVVFPGYMHPDEFFVSGMGGARGLDRWGAEKNGKS